MAGGFDEKGLREFVGNLRRLDRISENRRTLSETRKIAKEGVRHMKADHVWARSLPPGVVEAHPHKRFYQHSGDLVDSMKVGGVQKQGRYITFQEIEVGRGLGIYPMLVEFGSAVSRAFPFIRTMLAALRPDYLQRMSSATWDGIKAILSVSRR